MKKRNKELQELNRKLNELEKKKEVALKKGQETKKIDTEIFYIQGKIESFIWED
jgi:hypothetical protein